MTRVLLLFILSATLVFADGGAVIGRDEASQLSTTVFALPSPLRAGPADISVLVQKPGSNDPILDAFVQIAWMPAALPSENKETKWLPPCCSMESAEMWHPATTGNSKNKFLYAAMVPIKTSGPSRLAVRVTHGVQTQEFFVDIDARPPYSPALAYWPWLAFPPVAVGLFALRSRLAKQSRRS